MIWYDGKMVPWRDATMHVLTYAALRIGYSRVCVPTRQSMAGHTPSHRPVVPVGQIFAMKIPYTRGSDRRRAARVRARHNKLNPTCARFSLPRTPWAWRPSRIRCGWRRCGRGGTGAEALERHSRPSFTHHHPEHHDVQRQRRNYAVSILANQEVARRLRGGDARSAGVRLPAPAKPFVVRTAKLHARPSGGALNGITRDTIITFANELGIRHRAADHPRRDLHRRRSLHRHGR